MPFLKNLFLRFTESNSTNFVSEIIANSLKKLLTKIYRFQWDFSIQILSQFLCILKQNSLLQLLCDFAKGSSVPFSLLYTYVYTYLLLSLWILSLLHFSAYSLNFGQSFTPKKWTLSFLSKVLLQMTHLSSSSIQDKLKNEEDSIANTAIYPLIFILYNLCS